jgi:hypothetical protein
LCSVAICDITAKMEVPVLLSFVGTAFVKTVINQTLIFRAEKQQR